MGKITLKIAEETNGKSFSAYKYSYDTIGLPVNDYDDQVLYSVKEYGETIKYKNTINLTAKAKKLIEQQKNGANPLFTYFLDGSRRTFKIDDISYNKEVFPIIAGQVGVGCCKRVNKQLNIFKYINKNVIVLPDSAKQNQWDSDLSFKKLLSDINEMMLKSNIIIDDIQTYKTYSVKNEDDVDYDKKGIAVIQTIMVEEEKQAVSELASNRILNDSNYLLKDGSLEYRINYKSENELKIFRNNYRYVVGVSKSFNPANCVDEKGRSNTSKIVNLDLYHRTPVSMYTSQYNNNMKFAVWYIRIRDKKYTHNAYDGILKIEQILVSEEQVNNGIDSEIVDLISANIINERNPVSYGSDMRWANHLYPVYLTEKYVKSRYIGNTVFLNLF